MIITSFQDGHVILGDSTSIEVFEKTLELTQGQVRLINTDPPYGNIVSEDWDEFRGSDLDFAAWMVAWTELWAPGLVAGGAFYVWGGIGKPGFRPFLRYLPMVESPGKFELASLITWSKRRAYGVQNNYLFTREELAYFVRGNAKKPAVFNVPYLEQLRGYAGYNKKYPAKDERFRRTNVWTDINEIFRGKTHPTQKPQRTAEVVIEVHTEPGDWVIDPFAGSGTTAHAARSLGRRFVIVEKNEAYFNDIVTALNLPTAPK